ncbi:MULTISPECIES: DM13 domain-containing protein [unclassified Synechococcus]|uniref:DM13 domain-containing protein n=1 Tax=unclassified Synechococcus TaxID=2626047 RepID=UPI0020CC9D24|nr:MULTISPECIES: DM13 domain-containing protein [unclassified Synechococcus]
MKILSMPLAGALAMSFLGSSAALGQTHDLSGPVPTVIAQAAPLAMQSFRMAEAPVNGSFTIIQKGGKQLLVLSSDFKTKETAPDLKVIFSPSATPLTSSKAPSFPLKTGTYTVLAPLKSASGAQSYVIPASIDLSQQGSVMIWCEAFNATMAWAPLKP